MTYRPEIDGLRAIAVTAVILCHTGAPGFAGGYVGVDVFFVISGYLIAGLIFPEIEQGRFSVRNFYERRARRILPALFAVIACTAPFIYWLFSNGDVLDYSRSLIATILFVSNLFFWQDTGYFAAVAETKPLLHTWSLGIEEQFYILFPLLLLCLHRFLPRRLPQVLLVLLLASLVTSTWLAGRNPSAAFYLPHSRAWELLAGAVLAVVAWPRIRQPVVANVLATAGLALILGSICLYDEQTRFPGAAALPPCLGAVLFIWAAAQGRTAAGSLLSTRPFIGIGLVSYSLYLWHWPLLVFSRYYLGRPLHGWETVAAIMLCGLLAFASWKFIEQPFRKRSRAVTGRQILSGSLLAACMLAGISTAGQLSNGMAFRPAQAAFSDLPHDQSETCFRQADPLARLRSDSLCRLGAKGDSRADFILWGDSHADALFPAFDTAATQSGKSGLFAAAPACLPILGVDRMVPVRGHNEARSRCREFNDAVLAHIRRTGIRNVYLAARWNVAIGRPAYEISQGIGEYYIADSLTTELSPAEDLRVLNRALDGTLMRLKKAGVNVWIVLQVPDVGVDVPQYLVGRSRGRDITDVRVDIDENMARHQRMKQTIEQIARRHDVAVLDPAEFLCEASSCLVAKDGTNLYLDDNHLSPNSRQLMAGFLAASLASLRGTHPELRSARYP